jgi:polyribonucleotide nucleotidyltransferase
MSVDVSVEIGRERINFNTGYLAKQADGAVAVSCAESIVFASAVVSREVSEGRDFFPLTVDYREKFYSAGKIPGGYIKREGRPSDREVLTSRLSDRPLRPLFPDDFVNEVQVIIYVLSADQKTQTDVLAINAASAALTVSCIPFNGPVGAVRVGRVGGELVVNPTFDEMAASDIDLVVAGTKKAVTMIEGSSKNVSEDDIIRAVEFAHEQIIKLCEIQEELRKLAGKQRMEYTPKSADESLKKELVERFSSEVRDLINFKEKHEREGAVRKIIEKATLEFREKYPDTHNQIASMVDGMDYEIMRKRILDEKLRADGRQLKEIRPIDVMAGILPRAHGSAIFTRGQTQSLGIVTLGTVTDEQRLDALEGETYKRFMLHYNFPPFSVGEVGRFGGTGRREIGHGMLAERALEYVLPKADEFPYTIRIVSEILESNGSSSMASVCSGSLSLFNAGVPVKAAVAGIAMGLIMEGDKYAILSDIMGLEDHLGDMDFKVCGTKQGVTALQMDIKIGGITSALMQKALEQAKAGRLHILSCMEKALQAPRTNLSPFAPRIYTMKVKQDKIRDIIGQGGKTIRGIQADCGVKINIEDTGIVTIASTDEASLQKAKDIIGRLTEEVEVGKVYMGTVRKIMDFGAFVEVLPGTDGLVHISQLAHHRVKAVSDEVAEGDQILVKVLEIDKQGKIRLSRKETMPAPTGSGAKDPTAG